MKIAAIVEWAGQPGLGDTLGQLLLGSGDPSVVASGECATLGGDSSACLHRDGGVFLACDARIDNRDELLVALRPLPEGARGVNDGALIAAAFRKWGNDCPGHLIGDFAFVLWDASQRSLLAARDGMNMRTLSYLRTPGGLCLASEGQQLLRHPQVTPEFSELGLAGWISGWPDPNASMFDGIEVLPPGHALTADAQGTAVRKFWDIDPEKQIRYRRVLDYEEQLRALLERAVSDRLRSPAAQVASQMSGGMDSTTVTALANRAIADSDKKLLVISHTYHSLSSCDETDRIRETLGHLGIADVRFLAAEQHAELDFRALYPPVLESPGTVASPRYVDEMELLKSAGAGVLLTGSGGDEMAWGHSLTYSQRLRRGELKVVWEVINGCREIELPLLRTLRQLFVNPFVPAWLKGALGRRPGFTRLPTWLPESTIRRLDLEERLQGGASTRFRNPALQARYQALRHTSTINSVRSYGQVGAEYGIEVRHPFFDSRLAEFSFAIPDDLWIREGYPKWLLRRTMDGVLPDSVCWNRHKVIFDDFFGKVLKDQAVNVRGILADTRLEERGLLNTAELLATFDRVVAGQQGFSVDLLYALMAQIWYQKYYGVFGD